MKVVIQIVEEASVSVEGKEVAKIGNGYLLLVGIEKGDTKEDIIQAANKIYNMRINKDENDKTNLAIKDVKGEILSISQFTLLADLSSRRPSFINAASADIASELYDAFNLELEKLGLVVKKGVFGAYMKVNLVNDGPFTIVYNSKELNK